MTAMRSLPPIESSGLLADAAAARTALMRTHAQTFYFAARFLPATVREAVVTLYAFCRYADDLVDEARTPGEREQARRELAAWRGWLWDGARGPCPNPAIGHPLGEVLQEHCVPLHYLLDLIAGVESDLDGVTIRNFAELRRYCYRVASTVGLSMAHILEARSSRALAAAEELGVAMQLTNILRDVGADLALGRVYLPTEELAAFQCDTAHLRTLTDRGRGPDRRFRALMRFQVERAYFQYERGLEGIPLLPRDVRLAILVASRLYRGILGAIEAQRYDVLRRRAVTSPLTKAREAAISAATVELWDLGDRLGGLRAARLAR